jgi:sterol desaturase/sphingolipid hydroxylase (fatty acid hydroxylase superfamily)
VIALWLRRSRRCDRLVRWSANIAIALLDTRLLRLLFPAAAVGFALVMAERGIGLFNQVSIPEPIVTITSMLLLDLSIYVQHVIFHQVPVLWRIHRMHHSDLDIDVTTGARRKPPAIAALTCRAGIGCFGPTPKCRPPGTTECSWVWLNIRRLMSCGSREFWQQAAMNLR